MSAYDDHVGNILIRIPQDEFYTVYPGAIKTRGNLI